MINPFLLFPANVSNRLYKNCVSLAGKLFAGVSVNWQDGSYTIPASVVLHVMKRSSGFFAHSMTAS